MYLLVPYTEKTITLLNQKGFVKLFNRTGTKIRIHIKDLAYTCTNRGIPISIAHIELNKLNEKSLNQILLLNSLGLPKSEILDLMEPSNE